MKPEEDPHVRKLLGEVRKLPVAEQGAYLDAHCTDADLRRRVEDLLAADAPTSGSYDAAVSNSEAGHDDVTKASPDSASFMMLDAGRALAEGPGTVIGRYKLQQQIGEGGFGVVYQAEQERPVRRSVALKIIKLGMDTRQVITRFEAERQALAMMDHPNIARVLDAGATDTGRPYFVMELVEGVPITRYCDEKGMSFQARLELFIGVCGAVQHAHQKGIIHRDIKPSNILVATVDGKPVPKVIDFGIAKATEQRLTEDTMFTEAGQFIGTPAYMSPEQADPQVQDIDTRSDIYSLGVVLYELLTGTTPFDIKTLRGAALDEIKRLIREQEPSRPSTRLSSLGEELTRVAQLRGMEPRQLGTILRGDIDWILLKALEKDRLRRYETANGLARDIDRYLRHEPVAASPPSARYRAAKFVRRHRGPVAAAVALTVVLIIGSVGTGVGFFRARAANAELRIALQRVEEEKERAIDAEQSANKANAHLTVALARVEAEKERAVKAESHAAREAKEARRQAEIAEAVNDFLNHDLLSAVSPQVEGIDVTVREVLDAASLKLDVQFWKEPVVEAALRETIGMTYFTLGEYKEAERHLRKGYDLRVDALGPDNVETRVAQGRLASTLTNLNLSDEAEKMYLDLLEYNLAEHGEDHESVLMCLNDLGILYQGQGRNEKAEEMLVRALETARRAFGESHPRTLTSFGNLALIYQDLGRYEESSKMLTELVDVRKRTHGPDHPHTLTARSNLASQFIVMEDYKAAAEILEDVLEERRLVLGDEHFDTVETMSNLATAYVHQERNEEAERLVMEALAVQRRQLGEDHPSTLLSTSNLAAALYGQGRMEEALSLQLATLEDERRVLGDGHERTLSSLSRLGLICMDLERYEESEAAFREGIEGLTRTLGPDHPSTIVVRENLGGMYLRRGEPEKSLEITLAVLEARKRVLGEHHPAVARTTANIGTSHASMGNHVEAVQMFETALQLYRGHYGDEHRVVADVLLKLAGERTDLKQYEVAEQHYNEALAIRRKIFKPDAPQVSVIIHDLGYLYYAQGRNAEALTILMDALQMRTREHGPEHRYTYFTRFMMTRTLTRLGRFEEAEQPALKCYDYFQRTDGAEARSTQRCVKEIVKLYRKWDEADAEANHSAAIAEWRTRLTNPPPTTQPAAAPASQPVTSRGDEV